MENKHKIASEIISRYFKYILKKYMYYEKTIEKQDMIADAELVILTNPEIIDLYTSGKYKECLSLFTGELRKEARKWGMFSMTQDNNEAYTRARKRLAILGGDYQQLLLPEDVTLLDKIKSVVGEDDYEFVLDYYTLGMKTTSDIYGLSKWSAMRRSAKIIDKIRKFVENQ